jgi:hypothetical protein
LLPAFWTARPWRDQQPDPDHKSENLYRRRGRENPSGLILDAFRRRFRHDQRLGNAAAGDRCAIGFDRKPDPGAGYQRLLP